jgi:peptide/nickel transport system ATP-binding protein
LSRERIDAEVRRLIELVGLRSEHLERYPHQLSGGEIQRAVLARIISLQPRFVVADEMTSMLDASVQAQILRLMMKLQKETDLSYLFISHDLDVLKAVSDRIAYIENGEISETAAAHPRAASCGASKAPPHEIGTRLRRSNP